MTEISEAYVALGGASSFLGAPTTEETTCPDEVGHYRHFERGSIYWHPMTGAHEVHGAIREKWQSMGWERSLLGYPTTNESDAARYGKFNHFMGGSIYWTAETGAQCIYGPIWEKWQEMGWERGALGFPVADASETAGGERRQRFQGGMIGWTPQGGTYVVSEPQKLNKVLRVFLVRFADVPNPPNFTRDWFNRLFFSADELRTNPDGGPMSGSVFDYFYGISNGYVRVTGEVTDWITNPLQVTKLAHWADVADEVWHRSLKLEAGAVAPTLRERGIRTLDDLKVNGQVPDGLVFYHTDVWGGGGARDMAHVKGQLEEANRLDLWDDAWNAWADSMPIIILPCCHQIPNPTIRADHTFERIPEVSELHWTSSAVLMHELGHLLFDYPDLYNQYTRWYTWLELMGGDWLWNDFPPTLSSYMQERGGWFNITDMPRRTHRGVVLAPFETHNVAFRFQGGPIDGPETFVLENRTRYDLGVTPPTNLGNALFAYRVDPKMRQAILLPGMNGQRRAAFLIRRSEPWGEAWGIPGAPQLTGQGADLANSLNHLGERWWEFRNIRILSDGAAEFDAVFQPYDLIRGYAQATWANGDGQLLRPDFFHAAKGNVMLVNRSLPIEQGLRYNHVLHLHPNWAPHGKIRGRYSLKVPSEGARLYLTVALSEQAVGSDGFIFRVIAHGSPERILAEAVLSLERNIRTIVIDMSDFRRTTQDVTLEVDAGAAAGRDWVYILEAYLVPTSTLLYNFIDHAQSAIWRSNLGPVTFGWSGLSQGVARLVEHVKLQNGLLYGGDVLCMHPARQDDGYVEGVFNLTLPSGPSGRGVFRAEVGFDENRTITQNGARISARFVTTVGEEHVLLPSTLLERRPAVGEMGLQNNPVTSVAVPIPIGLRGVSGQFILRVAADGSAAQDSVWWPMARLTVD